MVRADIRFLFGERLNREMDKYGERFFPPNVIPKTMSYPRVNEDQPGLYVKIYRFFFFPLLLILKEDGTVVGDGGGSFSCSAC